MLKKVLCVLGIMFFIFPGFAQEESGDEPYLSIEDQEAILDKAADAMFEAEITAEDQEAILDKVADAMLEAEITAERKEDSPAGPEPYLVRIEVYSRLKTSYIAVGDLSLDPGFFFWMHDGSKQNGYAVYMYPVTDNVSKIKQSSGVAMLYGKSFRSAEEAIAEIQTRGTMFNQLIRYQPVINEMRDRLNKAPYQGGSK